MARGRWAYKGGKRHGPQAAGCINIGWQLWLAVMTDESTTHGLGTLLWGHGTLFGI